MDTVRSMLGEELYRQVQEKLGENKRLIIDDGMLIPKHRFDCINFSLKDHKKQLLEVQENLCAMQEKLKRFEKAAEEAADLKAELQILQAIMKAKPKNYLSVRSLINVCSGAGGKLQSQLNRRLSEIKLQEPYLFYGAPTAYRLVPIDGQDQTELQHE